MKNRTIILLASAALVALAAVLILNRGERQHSSAPVAAAQNPTPAPEPATPAPSVAAVTPAPAADTNTRATEPPAKKTSRTTLRADAKPGTSASLGKRSKPPIQDPDARAALAAVGVDPLAEAYWIQAINDPTLPAEERKDLIEDLNEDGLADPKHPRPEDMPIIASRIVLIEELAPDAADDVNAKAFAEAYKDLVKLWKGLPVD